MLTASFVRSALAPDGCSFRRCQDKYTLRGDGRSPPSPASPNPYATLLTIDCPHTKIRVADPPGLPGSDGWLCRLSTRGPVIDPVCECWIAYAPRWTRLLTRSCSPPERIWKHAFNRQSPATSPCRFSGDPVLQYTCACERQSIITSRHRLIHPGFCARVCLKRPLERSIMLWTEV